MSNINTFFDNAPLLDNLRQNSKEEQDQNDVIIMDDIDDFGQTFSNLNDIKKLNTEKNNENSEINKQAVENLFEKDKKLNPNFKEKSNTRNTIPIIHSDNINGKNVSSNIDNLFSNYKNSSLFNSNLNQITNKKLLDGKIEKETKVADLEQKMNTINLNEHKNLSNNNINNRNNYASNQIHFERNTKITNNAINSNIINSNKELISLINKPINSLDNKQTSKFDQENLKNFSNLNNNNITNINQTNSQNNSRYPVLNSRQVVTYGIRTLDNNTSINMNSAKNKNLNAYNNNNISNSSDYNLNQILNYSDLTNNNININTNSFSDTDQVNYDKLKTRTLQPPNQEFFSVKEFASREEMNPKCKNNMEDFVKIIDKFNENAKMGLFSLYDGHGGEDSVKYVKDRLAEILAKFIKNSNDSIDNCLISAFEKVDNELKFYDSENTGTTATVVVIHGKNLFLANVGDSSCMFINSNFEVKKISYDHKCTDEKEIERIKYAGGMIFNNRVFGQLALTRALGDHAIKKYGVISKPFTAKIEVKSGDFVVIASDGVWDVNSDEDVKGFIQKGGRCTEIVDAIVKQSLLKGSKDNISCIVLKI
jgi:serine/threonine protein phosphatase PrpC